jgi:colanic acid/amylovoran biosynthesis glycosyltransferase
MRVLVFSEGFGARTLTFVYNEVKALSEFCDVHVLCTEKGDAELLQYDKVTEIKWQPNRIVRRLKWELWKRDLVLDEKNSAFSKKLNELIDSFKPDVIHCHFGFEALKVTDNFTRNDIPIIVTFHGYDATEFDNKESYKRKLKATFDRPNIFPMFVSDYIRQRVARLTVNTEKGFLLYLGIESVPILVEN